jgi:hypothetical protein
LVQPILSQIMKTLTCKEMNKTILYQFLRSIIKELSKICSIKEEWECYIIIKLKINIKYKRNKNTKKTNKEKPEKIK